MADDPNKQDGRDRSKVAGDQDYEVQYFAKANGVTPDQARELIETYGQRPRDARARGEEDAGLNGECRLPTYRSGSRLRS